MKTHRAALLHVVVALFGALTLAGHAGLASAQLADSARSVPKDATPYVRPAIDADLNPDGRGAFSETNPFVVDVVVNNTDAALKNTDTFNDGELSIAINPLNRNEIVITSFAGGWGTNAPWWHSLDGGTTWTKRFTIPVPPGRPGAVGCPCDQVVDYGRKGRLFGTFLADNVYTGGSTNPASAAAFSWNAPGGTTQATNFNALVSPDQPWLVVNRDTSAAFQDNAWVAYDNFNTNPVQMRVSVALGTYPPNFTRDNPTGGTAAGFINPGHRLVKDPVSGWVYSLWQTCTLNCATATSNPKTVEVRLTRSTDGGQTWGLNGNADGIVVATVNTTQPQPKFGTVNALLGGIHHAAVDPRTGDVYVAYGTISFIQGIAVRRLIYDPVTNNLLSGPEVLVPASFAFSGAAIPSVAITDNGVVGVFYYTFDGFSFVGSLPIFTAHLSTSDNQGSTWTDQRLLTFLSSATDNADGRQRVLGDYMQLKAVGNTFYGGFTGNGVPFGRPFANHDPIFFKVTVAELDELDLAVRGTNNGIFLNHFSDGWDGWVQLPGAIADTPALVAREGGALDIVVRMVGNDIQHNHFDGTNWLGWTPLGGATVEAPSLVRGNYRTVSSSGAGITSASTSVLSGCDDCTTEIRLPFPVWVYGTRYDEVVASSNGNVQFHTNRTDFGNTSLPTSTLETALFAYWDDQILTGAGRGVFTSTIGSAPNRQFVIEWRAFFFGTTTPVNYEVIFYENSRTITVIYGDSSGFSGGSATAGIQLASTGRSFSQFSFNSAVLTPGTRIDYVPGDLELVIRGTDNGVYHNRFDGLNWSGFAFLGGLTSSRPALAAGANGTLELVVRGLDNGIYYNHFSGAAWSGFSAIGGATIDAPSLVSHGFVLDLVVRGVGNGVYHNRFTICSFFPFIIGWCGFTGLGGETPDAMALVKTNNFDAQVDLLVRGTDSVVYHNHLTGGGSWSGFVSLSGTTPSPPALTTGGRPGTLAAVVRGMDDGIYLSQFNGTLWSPFSSVGGTMQSAPALVSP